MGRHCTCTTMHRNIYSKSFLVKYSFSHISLCSCRNRLHSSISGDPGNSLFKKMWLVCRGSCVSTLAGDLPNC